MAGSVLSLRYSPGARTRRSGQGIDLVGAAFGNGFTALAADLALMSAGVALLGITVLGLTIQFSIFDHSVMLWMKNAMLKIIGGALIVGGAAGAATFVVQNFHA